MNKKRMNKNRIIIPSNGKISQIGPNTQIGIQTLGIPVYPDCFIFYALCLQAKKNPALLQLEAHERLDTIVEGFPMVFKKFGYSAKDMIQFYKEETEDEDKKPTSQEKKNGCGDEEQTAE